MNGSVKERERKQNNEVERERERKGMRVEREKAKELGGREREFSSIYRAYDGSLPPYQPSQFPFVTNFHPTTYLVCESLGRRRSPPHDISPEKANSLHGKTLPTRAPGKLLTPGIFVLFVLPRMKVFSQRP